MGISNIQYRDIMYEYDQKRMNNRRTMDARLDECIEKIPQIGQIQEQLIQLSMRQARAELLQPEEAARDLPAYKASMQKLIQQKAN